MLTRLDWRTSLKAIYDNMVSNNLHLVAPSLQALPLSEFWRKLFICLTSNDSPKFSNYSNAEILALFVTLHDPFTRPDTTMKTKWEII